MTEDGPDKRQVLDADGSESKLKLSKVPYQSSGGIMNQRYKSQIDDMMI